MGPKQPKRYWRDHPNTFPSGLEPLPSNLTATEIISGYPNHLEDRDVVLSLINDYGLHCGQIYNSMPASLKTISTKRLDVNRLGCKAYSVRGKRSKEEMEREKLEVMGLVDATYGIQYEYENEIEVLSSSTIRQDEAPIVLAQPKWVHVGVRYEHPALSPAAMYRQMISGTSSRRSRTYRHVPDDILATIAEGPGLGQCLDHFTAMARLVRYHARERAKQEANDEDDETLHLRALMFELTCKEVDGGRVVVKGQGAQGFAKIGGLARFLHHTA